MKWCSVLGNPDFLTEAKAGDDSALGGLLNQFADLLRARARESFDPRLRGRIGESDLVQMTLMTAADGFPAFRGETEAELIGWLKAILAQHMAATARWHLRTQKRAAGNEVLFQGLPTANSSNGFGGESLLGPAASGQTPSRFVMQQELRDRIRSAIAELPWEQQEAVRLKFIDEWPLAEIAEFLGKTERAVAGLVARGMKRLKDRLKDVE